MSSKLSNIFKLALTGLAAFILMSLAAKHREELAHLKNISAAQFSLISFLIIGPILINGTKLKGLIGSFDIKLTHKEAFGLSAITTSLNNLLFKSGFLFTSNYLKKRYEFPFMSFAGSQGADHLISFFTSAFCGFAVSAIYSTSEKGAFTTLSLGYLTIMVVLGLIFLKTFDLRRQPKKFLDTLTRAINSLYRILKNRKLFCALCAFNLLIVMLSALRFFLVCNALGLGVPFGYCLLFITLLPFISTIPVIQSDIGTRELIVGIFSQWLGSGFEAGMLASLLDRCFIIIIAIFISLFFRNLLSTLKLNVKTIF